MICRFIRWKGYKEDMSAEELLFIIARNEVPFSCLRTCQPWGVDENPATPESCISSRSCCEPLPLTVEPELMERVKRAIAAAEDELEDDERDDDDIAPDDASSIF